MLHTNHLLSLIPNRIASATRRLQTSIWTDGLEIPVEATEGSFAIRPLHEAVKLKRSLIKKGSAWGKLYDQRWCRVEFPKSAKPLFLNWREQGEATLYIDGVPYFGFDVAHRYCRLPQGVREAWLEITCVQSAIWHSDATGLSSSGSLFDGAYVCHRDEDAWQAYHDMKCLLDILLEDRSRENLYLSPQLNGAGQQATTERVSPFYRRLLRLLDEAVDELETKGLKACIRKLEAVYRELRQTKTLQHSVLTGHAHIDLVWLWPERIGELKAVHVFATMNHLMNEYPEFRFAYSQPASYEAVKKRSPRLYNLITKRIQQGKWQPTGGMYVESDTLIACGEALARSFILGQDGFTKISGKPSRLTWLPDVFGYSGNLPQLMKLTGVEYFFTTKLTWNAINRFPYSSFVWRGIDSSEIVSHVSQDGNYVTHMQVRDIRNGSYGHQQADIHNEFLLPTGFGDGGGGTTDEMCERAKRLTALPGLPSLSWGHPEEFFDRLSKLKAKLPVYQGECYLEYHRGTYTSHGNLKAAFRALERALQIHEAVSVATGSETVPIEAWKRMVFAQFHDYIPGSSVPEVYAEGVPELVRLGTDQIAAAKAELECAKKGELSVFNPLPVPVKTWLRVPGKSSHTLVNLPPLTGTPLSQVEEKEKVEPVKANGQRLSNGLVDLALDRKGAISSLTIRGKTIPIQSPMGSLFIYPDRPAHYDAWDIDRQALSLGERCDAPAKITLRREGDHQAEIAVTRAIGKKSQASVIYRLEAGSPVVGIEVQLDWQEEEHLLKMQFPTQYAATNARFGIPYGSILRPQIPSGLDSEAMWEVPFSRYLAVFDEGERDGLFLVTESKYGATVRSGNIGLSLVRSPRITGLEDSHKHVRPEPLTRLKPASIYSDQGRHVIRLAIGHYDIAAPREEQPAVVADTQFTTPVIYQGGSVKTAFEGLEGDSSLIPVWAVPESKKSWVLRLNEVSGKRGKATIRLARGWTASAVDLMGQPMAKKVSQGRFDYHPYEIVSLRISQD